MGAAGPKKRHLVAELELFRRRLRGEAAIASEGEGADPGAAVGKDRRHADASLREHDERMLRVIAARGVHAHLVDDAVVELRTEGRQCPAAQRPEIAAMRGHGEGAHSRGILPLPVPVAPDRERMVVADDEVLARERREDVGVAAGGDEGGRGRHAEAIEDAEEPLRGVGTHAVALQDLVVRIEQRLESVAAHAPLGGGEPECLVRRERAAEPEAQLVLRISLSERRRRRVGELEVRLVHRVARGALHLVRAAARRAGHLPTGELAAGHVVRIGDDTGIAHGFRRDGSGAKRKPVERDLVLVGPLAGDGKRGRR